MRFLKLTIAFWAICLTASFAQTQQPKIVVGIVVDQMRYDYLYRYESKLSEGGFRRLLRDGYSCENAHFNYVPTYTAPGHACIYTGATPSVNGIVSNEWWDPEWKRHRYVTTDTTETSIGATGTVGQHSPRVLLSSTITDELRLSNAFRSKVVGICLKDRASILPAGHFPNACFWFDDNGGNWITSSYYQDSSALPQWVQEFNARRLPDAYMSKPWTLLRPESDYEASFHGWEKYEKRLGNNRTGKFPYDLPGTLQAAGNYGAIRYTPFGNSLTLDFAIDAIEKMELGQDAYPDFLCISFSSTDYCGHHFGVHAQETEDTYLRLDADLARFLNYLDARFGKNNVLVFLTADHGGAETPTYLQDMKMPAGVFEESKIDPKLDSVLAVALGKPGHYVLEVSSQQVWLDHDLLRINQLSEDKANAALINYLRTLPGVYDAYTYDQAMALPDQYPYIELVQNGLHRRRSGDVFIQLDPAWHADDKYFRTAGTTHGSPYSYDTHVPLLWYGWHVRHGADNKPVQIIDIAPTLAAMLHIMEPSGSTGKVLEEVFNK